MKKIKLPILIISLFLSFSINLKLIIHKSLDKFISDFDFFDISFILKFIFISVIIYFVLYFLFLLIDMIPLSKKKIILTKKKLLIVFVCIFTTTLIYLLSHYPGVYLNDAFFLMNNPIDGMNPLIYSMVMSIVFTSLKELFDQTIAIFIMSLFQSIISSIILTYIIYWFNKKINNKILVIILLCYYTFTPIISNYNMTLNKDTPFALLILLFFTFVYEIVESKGEIILDKKFIFKLIVVSILSIYVRRNGILLIISTLLVLFLIYGIHKYKKNFLVLFLILIVFSSFDPIALKLLGKDYNSMEKYAIPIQQVSYLVAHHSKRLSEEDYDFLNKIIKNSESTIIVNYDEFTVDNIKYNSNFNRKNFNKYEYDFLKFWIKKYPNYIQPYTKSYLLSTYDLWAINKLEKGQSVFYRASVYGVKTDEKVYNKEILPDIIQKRLVGFYDIFNTFLNPGRCFILLMITCVYAYTRKNKKVFIISLPLISLWIELMLGTPLSSALRYMSPYIYILPIILLYTFKVTRENDLNGSREKSKRKLFK